MKQCEDKKLDSASFPLRRKTGHLFSASELGEGWPSLLGPL